HENSAEHMWHLAVAVLVLAEHAEEPVDLARVLTMVLIHDVVEIDAGDTFLYDEAARAGQAERERAAADRLYGLLPDDQGRALRRLWEEFEARETPDARFAAALDRLQSVLLNLATDGRAWREHGITADRVRAANAHMARGSAALWNHVSALLDGAVARGHLAPAPADDGSG
ncbi:MAG TPA: HD domain-containing protein, partial [Acidimicrobiales bacterium]|nr:HD domain-containing protein [Acidimicrobiales bacterium]